MPAAVEHIFHLAIPCRDLEEARDYYVGVLGAREARRRDDRITFDFFGHQLVCHLAPDHVEPEPHIYPRHFGVTFRRREHLETVLKRVREAECEILRDVSVRFPGERDRHLTFYLKDPSNNIIEFKYYNDPEMMY